jgi:hypothetical protein
MIWPVKCSLLRYISALPDGALSVEDGVEADAETGVFVFPSDPADSSGRRFRGDLRMRAHGGMLFVRIARPAVETVDGGGLTLTVLAPGEGETEDRLLLAHLTERARTHRAVLYDARLSESGAALFGGYYRPGEELDPVEVRQD